MTPSNSDNRTRPMVDGAKKLAREKTASDPLRTAIVTSLSFTPKTVAELADELGAPTEKIRYLLTRMRAVGLVEEQGEIRRRGVSQKLYSADLRKHDVSAAEAALIPAHRLDRMNARVLRRMFREAVQAANAGAFSSRPDVALIRYPLPLDEKAWREAVAIEGEVFERIFEAGESSRERLGGSGEEPIMASAMLMLFERAEETAAGDRPAVNPLRIAVIVRLTLEPASVSEVATELGVPAEQVRYQVKRLRQAGIVEIHGRRERRGAIEHTYSVDSRKTLISLEEARASNSEDLRKKVLSMLRGLFLEALEATRVGAFQRDSDFSLARVPLRLDAEGFGEICAAMESALERFFSLREETLARLPSRGGEARPATVGLLLFPTGE